MRPGRVGMLSGNSRHRRSFVKRFAWPRVVVGLLITVIPTRVSSGQQTPSGAVEQLAPAVAAAPPVTLPPESLFEKIRENDRDVARRFYKKHLDMNGLAILASEVVDDEALRRAYMIVSPLLADRPDILETMAKFGTRLIIIGKDQV